VLFLSTPELVNQYWRSVSDLLGPYMDLSQGDFDIDDLRAKVFSGSAISGVIFENNKPVMGIVFSFKHYSAKMSVNVLALAGSNLDSIANLFWPEFESWARQAGASEIEACTRPTMSRFLRRLGFTHKYDVVKLDLGALNENR